MVEREQGVQTISQVKAEFSHPYTPGCPMSGKPMKQVVGLSRPVVVQTFRNRIIIDKSTALNLQTLYDAQAKLQGTTQTCGSCGVQMSFVRLVGMNDEEII